MTPIKSLPIETPVQTGHSRDKKIDDLRPVLRTFRRSALPTQIRVKVSSLENLLKSDLSTYRSVRKMFIEWDHQEHKGLQTISIPEKIGVETVKILNEIPHISTVGLIFYPLLGKINVDGFFSHGLSQVPNLTTLILNFGDNRISFDLKLLLLKETNLTRLTIANCCHDQWDCLAAMTNLTSLNLSGCTTDGHFTFLEDMPGLKDLSIEESSPDIKSISLHSGLTRLSLYLNKVKSPPPMSHLVNLTDLNLGLTCNSFYHAFESPHFWPSNLVRLDISECIFSGSPGEPIPMPNLRSLDVGHSVMDRRVQNRDQVSFYPPLVTSDLESLNISAWNIDHNKRKRSKRSVIGEDEPIPSIGSLLSLNRLVMKDSRISRRIALEIGKLESLKFLDISHCEILEDAIEIIRDFASFNGVTLKDFGVSIVSEGVED